MRIWLSLAMVAVLLGCTGCSLRPHATYTLRYKAISTCSVDPPQGDSSDLKPCEGPDLTPHEPARVSAFVLDVPEGSSGKTVSDLPEKSQAEAVKVLGAKTTNTKDFLASIGSGIGKKGSKGGDEDRSVFKKRVVLAIVSQTPLAPADRFTYADLSLKFSDSQAKFVSWDKFATQYQTVDLGSLSYTQSRELDLKVSGQAPQGGGGEIDSKTANSLQEQQKLSQRFTTITGSLTPTQADLIQQGAPGIDLAGNVAVDVTIQVPADKNAIAITDFGELFAKGDKPTDPATPTDPTKLTVANHFITTPQDQCHDINANLTLTYILRHVVSGADTLSESDDVVELRKGTLPKDPLPVTFVSAGDLKVPTWDLRSNRGTLHIDNVRGDPGDLPAQPITFDSYDKAKEFLAWLIQMQSYKPEGGTFKIDSRSLVWPGLEDVPYQPAESAQLLIHRIDVKCP